MLAVLGIPFSIGAAVAFLTADNMAKGLGESGGIIVAWIVTAVMRLLPAEHRDGIYREYRTIELVEVRLAHAIDAKAVWRTALAELGQPGLKGIGSRLAERIDRHDAAGRHYEAQFWCRVLDEVARILNPKGCGAPAAPARLAAVEAG
ncbi:MAG: hypothetical protein U1E14_12910 [Geminicoccaceae bacterium]